MTRFSASLVLLICGSAVLLGSAGYEAYREITPYFLGGTTTETKFAALAARDYQPGVSVWSKGLMLADCREVAGSIYGRVQPTPRRKMMLTGCRDFAEESVAEMPAYSEAWLVAAQMSAELGDMAAYNANLKRSEQTAPNLHWLASLRVDLAEAHYDALDAGGTDAYHRDLRALLDSDAGARLLAEHYVADAKFRPVISTAAEAAPSELQRRFLLYVGERTAEAAP